MALGQAAGITASLSIDSGYSVQKVDISQIQDRLIKQKATLIYYRDIQPDNTNFPMVEYMGLRGYLPEWYARLTEKIDDITLQKWTDLSGLPLRVDKNMTRAEILNIIYSNIKH